MKCVVLHMLLLIVALVLSGCGSGAASASPPTNPGVEDQASLLAGLKSAGATAEVVDTITQDFFTPEGVFITVNGEEDIQVFEYETAQAMESEAARVAPDGGSVGTSMMMWVEAPHFYKAGRIIVLYIGTNATILDLLDKMMGPQFAGQ